MRSATRAGNSATVARPAVKIHRWRGVASHVSTPCAARKTHVAMANDPAMIVVYGLLTTAASNVFSNVYHVYQAEIFPSDVRATAVGWTYSVSRLSSAALPFILIPVLNHFGATTMFAVVLVALAATIAVLAPIGPRTAGRSLDEINPA